MDTYEFKLKPLPYRYNALEPYIDTQTVEIHHNRHLKNYVDKLNDTLKDYPQYQNWTLEQLLTNANRLPRQIQTSVINNGGGVYNHNLYFDILDQGSFHYPSPILLDKINKSFGSFERFKEIFSREAANLFGSGYVFLVVDKNNDLRIVSLPNQITPLPYNLYPIAALDVWEHAYYLKYKNKRADYINNWFNIVNWNIVEKKLLDKMS